MNPGQRRCLAVVPVVTALAVLACAVPPSAPPDEAGRNPESTAGAMPEELAVGLHAFRTADGNDMPYLISGGGDVTVLLVHCWMCDRGFWDAQLPVLQDRYRVIALDLPGHGEAGAKREVWKVETYGHDVADLIVELDLGDVILVGHSMGGPVSLKAAALAGDRVRGIVAVDTLHDAEFVFGGPQMQQILDAFGADFRGTCNAMVSQMFVEEGVDEVIAKVRRTGCEESKAEVGTALLRDFGSIDFPAWFRAAGVPIRAINAAAPNPTRIETNRKYADFDAVLMEGVGHYLHMTRPDEFNAKLLAALDQLDG